MYFVKFPRDSAIKFTFSRLKIQRKNCQKPSTAFLLFLFGSTVTNIASIAKLKLVRVSFEDNFCTGISAYLQVGGPRASYLSGLHDLP